MQSDIPEFLALTVIVLNTLYKWLYQTIKKKNGIVSETYINGHEKKMKKKSGGDT